MRMRLSACLFLLWPLPALANTAIVDCSGATMGAFTSINAAMASLPGTAGHIIKVKGTCVERVVFGGWDNLRLEGNPSATLLHDGHPTNFAIVTIRRSQDVSLRDLTIGALPSGPAFTPVVVADSTVNIDACTLQGGTALASGGLWVMDRSRVQVRSSLIQDSSPSGIRLDHGELNLGDGNTLTPPNVIERNSAGLRLRAGAHAVIWGNNVIRNNGQGVISNGGHVFLCCTPGLLIADNAFSGIQIQLGGDVQANSPVTFENNGTAGVRLISGSAILNSGQVFRGNGQAGNRLTGAIVATGNVHLDLFNAQITGNHSNGLLLEDNSSARLGNNVIRDNGGDGIQVIALSSAQLFGGNTVNGNAIDLSCTPNSYVRGDDSGVGKKKCPGFDHNP